MKNLKIALYFMLIYFIILLGNPINTQGASEQKQIEISQLTQSTSGYDSSYYPDWSPDGKKIVFERQFNIWIMNADGTNKINITKNRHSLANLPSWSPNGEKITYIAIDKDPPFQIWVMNPDGTGNLQLTEKETQISKDDIDDIKNNFENIKINTIAEAKAKNKYPINKINLKGTIKEVQKIDDRVIIVIEDGTGEIPIMYFNRELYFKKNAKIFASGELGYDSGYKNKTFDILLWAEILFVYDNYDIKPSGISNAFPVWSHDGKKIAYTKSIDIEGIPKLLQIWIMNSDGSNKEKLLTQIDNSNSLRISEKSWSQDENYILFEYNFDIWAVDVKTKAVKQLTDNNDQYIVENSATWSPDGKKVTFATRKSSVNGTIIENGIANMNFDGTERRYLFKDENNKWGYINSLAWSPDSNKIAFSVLNNGKNDIFVANIIDSTTGQSKESDGFELIMAILGLGFATYFLRK